VTAPVVSLMLGPLTRGETDEGNEGSIEAFHLPPAIDQGGPRTQALALVSS
jgi:hypothetical protein